MADKDQPNKADKAGGKAPTGTRKAPETKSRTQTKRAAPARRTPRQAKATPQEAKGATGSPSAEADSIAREASERPERLKRTGFSEALSESARRVAARSNADMTEGVNAMERATVMTKLGREVARIGAKEVLEGAQVLMASEEIAAESLAVEALSGEDMDLGLALAGISGQLGAMTRVVDSLGTAVISEFLDTRSEQLRQLAETLILRAGATATLALALAETGEAVAELGEAEMAEGEAEFAVSAQETAEGEELAGAGLGLMMMGMAESAEAEGFRQEAERVAEESSTKPSAEAKTAS